MESKKITEIKLISWLMIIMEIIALLLLIPFIVLAFICEGTILELLLFFLFPLLLLTLIIANIGILKLKEWSRKLLIYAALLGIMLCVISIYISADNVIIDFIIFIILATLLHGIYYFTRSQIKTLFRPPT